MVAILRDRKEQENYTNHVLDLTFPTVGKIQIIDVTGLSFSEKAEYAYKIRVQRSENLIPDTLLLWYPNSQSPIISVPATDRGDLIASNAKSHGYQVVVSPVRRERDFMRNCYIYFNDYTYQFVSRNATDKIGTKMVGSAIASKLFTSLDVPKLMIMKKSNNIHSGTGKIGGSANFVQYGISTSKLAITMDFDYDMAENIFEREDNIRTRVLSLNKVLKRKISILELKNGIIKAVNETFPYCDLEEIRGDY